MYPSTIFNSPDRSNIGNIKIITEMPKKPKLTTHRRKAYLSKAYLIVYLLIFAVMGGGYLLLRVFGATPPTQELSGSNQPWGTWTIRAADDFQQSADWYKGNEATVDWSQIEPTNG